MPSSTTDRADLPLSALYVLEKIEANEPVRRQWLVEEIPVSERTVDAALQTLVENEFVTKTHANDDLREVVVRLADD